MTVLVCFASVPAPSVPAFLFTRCGVVGDITDIGGCQLAPEAQNGQVQSISDDCKALSLKPSTTTRDASTAFFQRGAFLVMQPVAGGPIAAFPFVVESN